MVFLISMIIQHDDLLVKFDAPQVQAVCNKLNLFIDDQQQLAETKTGPRYGFVFNFNLKEESIIGWLLCWF